MQVVTFPMTEDLPAVLQAWLDSHPGITLISAISDTSYSRVIFIFAEPNP